MPARLRPPATDDAEAVLAVVHARDVAELGVPDFTLGDLRGDWATPGLALEHDARVAAPAGRIEGHEPQPLERWRAKTIAKEGHDPSLWLLLEDGVGIAVGMRPSWQAERWEKPLGAT
jgi:hypothetical protein